MEINEKSCFALWDQLLGALVALARAAENEPPSPSAHRAVLDGLACVLACYDARRIPALRPTRPFAQKGALS